MPISINSITFKAGASTSNTNPLEVKLGSVLILVGPNNSGKSLSLREIENKCIGKNPTTMVISDMNIQVPTDPNETITLLKKFETDPPDGQIAAVGNFWIGIHTFRTEQPILKFQINELSMRNATTNQELNPLLPNLVAPYTVRLDGRTRFALANNQKTGDIKKSPENHLWALFKMMKLVKRSEH